MADQRWSKWSGMVPVAEIPQSDGLVVAGGGQSLPVRGKRHGPHRGGMTAKSPEVQGRGESLLKVCLSLRTIVELSFGDAQLQGTPGILVTDPVVARR